MPVRGLYLPTCVLRSVFLPELQLGGSIHEVHSEKGKTSCLEHMSKVALHALSKHTVQESIDSLQQIGASHSGI